MFGKVKFEVQNSQVEVRVVIVSAGFTGETHRLEASELTAEVSLDMDVEVNKLGRDADSQHLKFFEVDSLAPLRLIEGGVVISNGIRGSEMLLAESGKVRRALASVDKNEWVSGLALKNSALIFFDWAEQKHHGVMH